MADAYIPTNPAEVAQQLGLPADAPLGEIDFFFNSKQTNRGDTKTVSLAREKKKAAHDAIMRYMRDRGLEFLQYKTKFLVIKEDVKSEGWSNLLVAQAYMAFHTQAQQGSPAQVAERFVNFCNQLRRKRGEKTQSLSVQMKRPFRAVLQGMLSGPNAMGLL